MKTLITTLLLCITFYSKTMAQANPFVHISLGNDHSTGIKADGTLWAWGENHYGQLGDGTTVSSYIPKQIGTENNWKEVRAGYMFTIAIKNDGTIWAWGFNSIGQLGNPDFIHQNPIPTQIGTDNDWVQASAGLFQVLAIKSNGTLWAWGFNAAGVLGNGKSGNSEIEPVPIQIGTDNNWKSVITGNYHTVALRTDGTVWAWGFNDWGELGNGTSALNGDYERGTAFPTPAQVGTDNDWQQISTHEGHTMAIKNNGTLWAWGSNIVGQLGDGTTTDRLVPVQIGTANNWTHIAAGYVISWGIQSDGTLWGWGYNPNGETGDGTRNDRLEPTRIGTSTNWVDIIRGRGSDETFIFAGGIQSDGTYWAWGNNFYKQLGNGTNINIKTPTLIEFPMARALATDGDSDTQPASKATIFKTSTYNPIASIVLNNNTDNLTAKLWVAAEQPANYVKRHFQITPTNAETTTGTVTLYFSNQDFKDFNATSPDLLLPDIDDTTTITARKANLKIEKRSGTSNDDSGMPDSYTGNIITIDPDDENIVWNASYSRWEVTFNTTGFSGFFAKTQADALPVTFGNISAIFKNGQLIINWNTLTEINNSHFEIEASSDGKNFTTIKKDIASKAKDGNSSVKIDYDISLDQSSWGMVWGASLLAIFGFVGFARNKKWKLLSLTTAVILLLVVGCKKYDQPIDNGNKKLFIRLVQVDKDGTKQHSKTIQVTNLP